MRFTAWLVLVATLLLWSGNWIVARAVRAEVSPAVATVGRLLIVLVILAPFAFTGLRDKWARLSRSDWKIFAALGLAGGGPHLTLQWLGLHYTTAASGILSLSTTPIFILLLSRPLLRERIRAARWAGVAVSFSGVFLIATQGDPAALSFNRGDLMALASMAMWGSYTVLLRVRRDPLDVVELLVMVCLFGVLFMLPWLAWEALGSGVLHLSLEGLLAVLYSAIGSLLLAYAGRSYVVARLGPARAGVTLHLMPAFGVLLSAIFLGEYPRWYHFAGIALILAGVAASSLKASSASSNR
jgi:drug/metabolite transporter (DMT)-like permease